MMTKNLTVTEQIHIIRARLELNQKTVQRLRHMLTIRHDFYYQPVGDYASEPTIELHEFRDPFDLVIDRVLYDKQAQIREDEQTLAGLRGKEPTKGDDAC